MRLLVLSLLSLSVSLVHSLQCVLSTTGGVAGDDITQGLPRVEELFEARKPKGLAIITEFAGVATIKDTKKKREIIVTSHETGESKAYLIPYGSRIKITEGSSLKLVMSLQKVV